jgi:hypothetical protein
MSLISQRKTIGPPKPASGQFLPPSFVSGGDRYSSVSRRQKSDSRKNSASIDKNDRVGSPLARYFEGAATVRQRAQARGDCGYRRLLALKQSEADSREVYWARHGLGDIERSRGRLDPILASYQAAQSSADRLAKAAEIQSLEIVHRLTL